MLTPQEIQEKKFEKAVFGGYDMTQIDEFLDVVLGDYTALYKENATLKGKMRVLVDKIEEYRSVDEEMRKALYTAQVSSKEIVAKAQSEAEALLRDARAEADARIGNLRQEVENERRRLEDCKRECSQYAESMKALLNKNIEVLDRIVLAPAASSVQPGGQETRQQPEMRTQPEIRQQPQADPRQQADTRVSRPIPEQEKRVPAPPPAYVPGEEDTKEIVMPVDLELYAEQARSAPERDSEEMETKFYEFELGDRSEGRHKKGDTESDTERLYGKGGTPKPRFAFSDLKFGKDYKEENDEE